MKAFVLTALLVLSAALSVADDEDDDEPGFHLTSVEASEEPDLERGDEALLDGEFELVASLDTGRNVIGVLLTNNTGEVIKISRAKIRDEESYQVIHEGEFVPMDLRNHQFDEYLEKMREERGIRWFELDPDESIRVTFDASYWSTLKNVECEGEEFVLEIRPNLFRSKTIFLQFRKHSVEE